MEFRDIYGSHKPVMGVSRLVEVWGKYDDNVWYDDNLTFRKSEMITYLLLIQKFNSYSRKNIYAFRYLRHDFNF